MVRNSIADRFHFDPPLLVGVLLMSALGLMVLYSASEQSFDTILHQGLRLTVGLMAMIIVAQIPPYRIAYWAPILYLIEYDELDDAIKEHNNVKQGLSSSIYTLVNCGLEVFAQNIETVERLTHQVRDIRAGYQQTLDVLAESKNINPSVLTKTSIILGLGETDKEIEKTMDDLIKNKVDILTIGQYLRPTRNHHPIERWVTPEEFERYRKIGLEKGFLEVVSGPMVRSSYRAERALQKNNAGL